jgi:hypothetical protein
LAVGVDLFFNAGLFVSLFDQEREPALLADPELFRRVPVAYVAVAVGVIALAWLLDRTDTVGAAPGGMIGGLGGLVVATLGIINVWTALDMTLALVGAGTIVQVSQFAAAGAFLGAYRASSNPRRIMLRMVAVAFSLAIAGIVLQNLLAT